MTDTKENKRQRILSVILSLMMVITMFPLMSANSVQAAEEIILGNLKYTMNADNSTVTLTGVVDDSSLGQLEIPGSIIIEEGSSEKTYTVTSIGEIAFQGCESLTKVTIPASVKTIEDGAFAECENLAEVTFADDSQLETIGGFNMSGLPPEFVDGGV